MLMLGTFHPRRLAVVEWVALVAPALIAGCGGQPQVATQNRELIVSLATAVSARNAQWLESNAKVLEERRSQKLCSDSEYKTFREIIDNARAGDWKTAEAAVYALRDAQRPTADDLKNLESRKLDPDHHARKPPSREGRQAR